MLSRAFAAYSKSTIRSTSAMSAPGSASLKISGPVLPQIRSFASPPYRCIVPVIIFSSIRQSFAYVYWKNVISGSIIAEAAVPGNIEPIGKNARMQILKRMRENSRRENTDEIKIQT
jgi:hypothetical protein